MKTQINVLSYPVYRQTDRQSINYGRVPLLATKASLSQDRTVCRLLYDRLLLAMNNLDYVWKRIYLGSGNRRASWLLIFCAAVYKYNVVGYVQTDGLETLPDHAVADSVKKRSGVCTVLPKENCALAVWLRDVMMDEMTSRPYVVPVLDELWPVTPTSSYINHCVGRSVSAADDPCSCVAI